MSAHDWLVAGTAVLATIAGLAVPAGLAWAAWYPVISRIKSDLDALWTAHRALQQQVKEGDDKHP